MLIGFFVRYYNTVTGIRKLKYLSTVHRKNFEKRKGNVLMTALNVVYCVCCQCARRVMSSWSVSMMSHWLMSIKSMNIYMSMSLHCMKPWYQSLYLLISCSDYTVDNGHLPNYIFNFRLIFANVCLVCLCTWASSSHD